MGFSKLQFTLEINTQSTLFQKILWILLSPRIPSGSRVSEHLIKVSMGSFPKQVCQHSTESRLSPHLCPAMLRPCPADSSNPFSSCHLTTSLLIGFFSPHNRHLVPSLPINLRAALLKMIDSSGSSQGNI